MASSRADSDPKRGAKSSNSEVETLEFHSAPGLENVDDWPCLTILYHPDLRRIGEISMVGQLLHVGQPVVISRNQPDFAHTGNAERRTLRDQYLSRKPIYVNRVDDERVEIAPGPGVPLEVDGHSVREPTVWPLSDLRTGVVLELSRRVVLLLHTVAADMGASAWGLVGESDGILEVKQKITQVSDLDVPVLIRGETGVGKERVAQAIHVASRRSSRPCISVNMATIIPTTAASELFGHVRGAFTGAAVRHVGLFERANGGTLFLDEIGETPNAVQAMLLRALAEGTIMAVGDQVERDVDVRVIAATDAQIEVGGDDGSFRAALFHRLSGYEIRIPPLRARRDDIPRLIVHFLERELDDIGESWRMDPSVTSRHQWFPTELMVRLYRHDWPGNVRQLSNVVRQLVISSRGNKALRVDESVERVLLAKPMTKSQLARRTELDNRASYVPGQRRELPSQREVYEAMHECGWNITVAARELDVPRSTLYNLIQKHPHLRTARELTREEIEHWIHECYGDLDRIAQKLEISKRAIKLRIKELGVEWED